MGFRKKIGIFGVVAGVITLVISLFIAVRVPSVRFKILKP
jgi:hypothetical protein